MEWIICPFVTNWPATKDAIDDALEQTLPDVNVLLINNGQEAADEILKHPRVLYWKHTPAMLSLSATWNRALQFVWACGEGHALVVNNDIRMWRGTYQHLLETQQLLDAYFVSATGVTRPQYDGFCDERARFPNGYIAVAPTYPLPGPDFSCYLITKEGHEKYPFDEGYIPAYCEDIDTHRRYMLGGDGQRIFGTGLPYHHVGAGTLSSLGPEAREALNRRITNGSRVYHQQKWGGGANQERYTLPFNAESALDGVTTPELFDRVRNGKEAI